MRRGRRRTRRCWPSARTPLPGGVATRNLSPAGDPAEAARNLFAMLRELDASGASRIAVMPIPAEGLGVAVRDRLGRAAAPRPS